MLRSFQSFVSILVVVCFTAAPLAVSAQQTKPIVIGQTFMAAGADPAEGNAGWALTSHGVGENLFAVNAEGQLDGVLAENITREADGSWIVTLRQGRKFADGSPVTAADVAASLGRTNERNAAARGTVGKMTLEALDERRVRIRSERPTPVMAAVLAEWPFVVYRMGAAPIFTGPYMVESLRPGDGISLQPNPNYAGAAARIPVMLKRFPDAQAMAFAMEGGEIDMAFNLPAETVSRLKRRQGTDVKSFLVAYQYMMILNTKRDTLSDARVRQAIDLGVDRAQLVAAVQGGEPATGAFPRSFPFSLKDPRPVDVAAANKLLDDAGWKRGADGKRSKDGKPLDLMLTAYPQRADLVTMQPVLRAQLSALGIGIQTRVVENAGTVGASGDFDLLLWAQHTAPAGDPGFFLNAMFRTGGGNNYAGFTSAEVDALLNKLGETSDPATRAALAGDIQRKVFAAAPVSFLLTPSWHVGVGPRLSAYQPWGSDYYIIRSDLAVR
jgi:peptide/nickel transport system substrate-binding protein